MQLHHFAAAPSSGKFVKASDYAVRLDVLFRGHTEDVTGQILNAFKVGILPRLKEYMPKRDELLSAALTVFVERPNGLPRGSRLTWCCSGRSSYLASLGRPLAAEHQVVRRTKCQRAGCVKR